MICSYDITNLNAFLKNFYNAVGIRISVFDNEFQLVTEYPENPPKFCSLIRNTPFGPNACKACDIAAFKTVKKSGVPYVYTCHAGLTEAVTPIKLGDGILGYVILAHLLPQEDYEKHLSNAFEKAQNYGVEAANILPALKEIPPHTKEHIDACVHLLDAVAAYLQITNWITWKAEDLTARITQYIELNIDKELNSDLLCKIFYISRTKLYQIAINAYGKSINKYIQDKKIARAKALLKSNHSIAYVAQKTGFSDPNYFSKVFKKKVGCSASEYKEKHNKC